MNESLKDEISANLARAHDSLEAAQLLLQEQHHDFAASRAYYAAFYAATASLLANEKQYRKHGNVIGAIHRDFVKTGKLEPVHGKNLNWLFELRSIGDYGEVRHVTLEEAEQAINAAQAIVKALEAFC